jgi:hypothetical protein
MGAEGTMTAVKTWKNRQRVQALLSAICNPLLTICRDCVQDGPLIPTDETVELLETTLYLIGQVEGSLKQKPRLRVVG